MLNISSQNFFGNFFFFLKKLKNLTGGISAKWENLFCISKRFFSKQYTAPPKKFRVVQFVCTTIIANPSFPYARLAIFPQNSIIGFSHFELQYSALFLLNQISKIFSLVIFGNMVHIYFHPQNNSQMLAAFLLNICSLIRRKEVNQKEENVVRA